MPKPLKLRLFGPSGGAIPQAPNAAIIPAKERVKTSPLLSWPGLTRPSIKLLQSLEPKS
jgi:hypothetical protein